jgi:hypothetical protein
VKTHVIEHRRDEQSRWMRVTTVQDDLVDVIAPMIPTEPGEWRLRPEDPEPRHPAVEPAPGLPKPTLRERVRWWWTMRTAPRGRR